jgi:hypothetical protein
MRERRIDRVTIAGSRDATTVTIPWASRGVLLQRLRDAGDAEDVIRAFEAVGTSRPVRLDKVGKRRLLEACTAWLDEPGGVDALPEGIFDLRNALEDEKADGERDSA